MISSGRIDCEAVSLSSDRFVQNSMQTACPRAAAVAAVVYLAVCSGLCVCVQSPHDGAAFHLHVLAFNCALDLQGEHAEGRENVHPPVQFLSSTLTDVNRAYYSFRHSFSALFHCFSPPASVDASGNKLARAI